MGMAIGFGSGPYRPEDAIQARIRKGVREDILRKLGFSEDIVSELSEKDVPNEEMWEWAHSVSRLAEKLKFIERHGRERWRGRGFYIPLVILAAVSAVAKAEVANGSQVAGWIFGISSVLALWRVIRG